MAFDAMRKEHLLRHLVHRSPELRQWQEMGEVRRGAVHYGFAIDADTFRLKESPDIEALWVAVELLAERCEYLEKQALGRSAASS